EDRARVPQFEIDQFLSFQLDGAPVRRARHDEHTQARVEALREIDSERHRLSRRWRPVISYQHVLHDLLLCGSTGPYLDCHPRALAAFATYARGQSMGPVAWMRRTTRCGRYRSVRR